MFPSSTLFHYPILLVLADGKEHTQKEFREKIIEVVKISKEAQNETLKNGANKVTAWTGFAVRNLMDAKLISTKVKGSGKYFITEAGKQLLSLTPNGFKGGPGRTSLLPLMKKLGISSDAPKTESTPEEQPEEIPIPEQSITVKLSDLAASANATLPESLLEAVKRINPKSFEILIKKLLLKMGYGQSTDDVVVTQYSKDGGIDAYVNADALGIKKLCCVQAKRYSDSVDVKTVRELVGSLAEYDCENGIIITTSSFTKGAKDYNTKRYQILLVDGRMLADYMIKYGLGIKTMKIEVKTVDLDFLNSL